MGLIGIQDPSKIPIFYMELKDFIMIELLPITQYGYYRCRSQLVLLLLHPLLMTQPYRCLICYDSLHPCHWPHRC
jgi:hypothetical protein